MFGSGSKEYTLPFFPTKDAADRVDAQAFIFNKNEESNIPKGGRTVSDELAKKYLDDAVSIAKDLNDRVLRFKAEFQLYKIASRTGNQPTARALSRRLRRLAPWLPDDTPEMHEFRGLST